MYPVKQRLLLVDDSAIIGKRLNTILNELPYIEVLGQATYGMEAVQMINDWVPDIVLLDINIAGTSGFHLLKWVHDSYKQIKVVMLSLHADAEYRNMALSLGADYFLDKANEFDQLSRVLLEIKSLQSL